MKKSVVKFDANKMAAEMMKNLSEEQTRRLVEYAEKEIKVLGDKIQTYHSANHMDRTGNLLNSLCWCVTYGTGDDNKHYGFYRSEASHNKGIDRTSEAWLHEYTPNEREEVHGRQMAESFVSSYQGKSGKWTACFAILAPYWGYWESGFTMKSGGGASGISRSTRFMQFQVMTHIFDDVRMALKPAETHLTVYRPKYSYKNPKYKNKRGYKKFGIIR